MSFPRIFLTGFILILGSTTLPHGSFAEEKQEKEYSESLSLYKLLVGNTLVGSSSEGNNSMEYHAPDGRVLGFNWDDEKNINSCWRVAAKNTVCYYYEWPGTGRPPREACWYNAVVDDTTIHGLSTDSDETFVLKIEKGNSRNLTDNGKAWVCGAQIVANLNDSLFNKTKDKAVNRY